MYAINHAATALVLKREFPEAPMLLLLVSVQFVEIAWVVLNYINIEHFAFNNGKLALDFLPYSHSVFSSVILALFSLLVIWRFYGNKSLGIAFAIGVASHVFLDVFFHDPDIQLSPFQPEPSWGFGIINFPLLNFIFELMYGIFCWWFFRGNLKLLMIIVVFNLLNLPVKFASEDFVNVLGVYRIILPTFILFQIVITWYVVWRFSIRSPIAEIN